MHALVGWLVSWLVGCFFWLAGLMLNAPVNSYGHVGTVKSPNHTFILGKHSYAVNQAPI